jgi:tetratricopeptide (TPR) repeat protein/predicted Ser/Thr protein kinase
MTGEWLNQYRIDAQLGAGGMGVVYRAYDTRLHRTVAIKRLQDPRRELSAERVLDEARAASILNHPNICTIYDVAENAGHPFIVMEYVDGRPLSEVIPRAGLPLKSVLEYGQQIADALGFAHENGIVHRDIKSSNIIITHKNRAKVLDFGLARRLPPGTGGDPSVSPRTTLNISGTPAYMSPEALRGEPSSPATDVWSLGVVLYEMASGQRPYDHGTPFELAAEVLSSTPIEIPAQLPPALATIISRCLTKQASVRYRQGGEVRAALEAVQLSSGSVPLIDRPALRRPTLRRVVLAGAAAAMLIAGVLAMPALWRAFEDVVTEPAIAFAERDWLLVADFANETGDPAFDRGLNTALAAALTQSRYVNIVPSNRIRESMRRMGRTPDTRTDAATAREIALREGFRMALAPTIASMGSAYLLTASFLDPSTGTTLKTEQVHASSRDGVLSALDELSARIRGVLGESRDMIASQGKPLARVTTTSLDALQRFSLGREAHIAQQLDKARVLYEEALRIDPAFTSARGSLGLINVEFFDRQKGLELLSQSINAADGLTDNERVSLLGFHALYVEKNPERAVDHYRAFLALHPDSASAHNNLGRIYLQQRRFKEAIAELQETIRLDPDLFLAYFSLNSIYLYETGELDAAIQLAVRQIQRNAQSPRAYGQLATAYVAKGDLRQAETAFRKALELDARFTNDWYRLGHVLRLQGRHEEARHAYLRVLEIDPKDISAHYEAGAISQLIGDDAAAERYLRTVITESERSLKTNPDGERFLELASAYARMGARPRAQAIMQNAAALTANLHVERAGVLVQLGRDAEAIATLENAVDNGFRNLFWMRAQADLHTLQNDPRFLAVVARME